MTADFRSVAAALGNDHARLAFARLALGESEEAIVDDLGPARAAKAFAALRSAGLIEPDAVRLRPEIFREFLAAAGPDSRPTGVDRFLSDGRIDHYPVRADEREAVLRWALERSIPLEATLLEADVTARLATVTGDPILLRRYLIDAGMMRRTPSGSEYTHPRGTNAPSEVELWGDVLWSAGAWTHDPAEAREVRASANAAAERAPLDVTAVEGSDAWRITSYGFVHDTEHALLAPFAHGSAVEVSFVAAFDEQFDQAGLFVRIDEKNWIKAGVEYADGVPQVGAVVTREVSDWSVAPVPEWAGRLITVRASWDLDALTIRARADDEPFRLVRVVPLEPSVTASAGPMVCAPTRAGLTVRFARWTVGEVDGSLH